MPGSTPHTDPVIPLSSAVLGIGLMGYPMARRLCEAGHQVTAWNRSRAKAERLQPFGARVADTPAQAVAQADFVITLLENGDVVEDVLFRQGVATALRPGTLVVDMSSILPRQARDHAARLAALGAMHLDAPVSGGTVGAEAGSLAIMAGGEVADFERAAPVFNATDLDAELDARARTLWQGQALTQGYVQTRQKLEQWLSRWHELELDVAARECYLLGNEAIRQLIFDPLLPDPLVDMQARRDFTQCVLAFDQTGHEIWRKLLPSMSL